MLEWSRARIISPVLGMCMGDPPCARVVSKSMQVPCSLGLFSWELFELMSR